LNEPHKSDQKDHNIKNSHFPSPPSLYELLTAILPLLYTIITIPASRFCGLRDPSGYALRMTGMAGAVAPAADEKSTLSGVTKYYETDGNFAGKIWF
ncbi:MAG: hypothetical protein IJ815_01220, partial [Lachnospiraceae bacterium]|nr:hypothetical protein [Lachnospiraceae bacterium]